MRIGPWPSTSVKIDIDKAQTKLRKIRAQWQRRSPSPALASRGAATPPSVGGYASGHRWGRLDADGASSAQNNNRRLLWLAIEWGLERAPKVGAELCDYCRKHGINVDWILDGDLRGLKRMIDERRGHQRDERALLARYAQLTPEHQLIVTAEINRILAERD
ncbi:hypothetical protein GA0061099_1004759 [Bradyrhizobium yuanmingense]|uniref:Uncharacterized protein n=2 Tax=Bradyrhizobium yuanmingense TaxID=108015 RepID=A0A1C3VWU6_9BRAD|nr:hypothetical protein IQ15_02518 [Bradyrhizobium yuanmingense]SCB32251.1 hypothetical protein GA0061099_1004759 [Bradyrhizobium yuanmingense]